MLQILLLVKGMLMMVLTVLGTPVVKGLADIRCSIALFKKPYLLLERSMPSCTMQESVNLQTSLMCQTGSWTST